MRGTKFMAALAVVVFGAGLMASPAAAKCSKDCKTQIRTLGQTRFQACLTSCSSLTKKDKKRCIKAFCKPLKKQKSFKMKCKNNSGTPPSCGSPSGAFIDASLE